MEQKVFRKSWVAYLVSALWMVIPAVLIGGIVSLFLDIPGVILMAVAFVLGVAGASWSTSSVRWVVNKDGIEGTGGVLPWKRANFYYTFDQIFDVYWRRPKIAFLGWLFNVGTIGFRTASGVADALEQNLMARPQRFHELGLEYTGQANQAQVDHSSDSANGSVADELERLAKLRDQGNISEEEYEKLKAKALSE